MERWSNKIAVVTGAASGIGAQISRDLCSHDVTVVGVDYNKDFLQKTCQEISKENPSARYKPVFCDLTSEDQIQTVFESIIEEFEGVDILVNSAGVVENNSILGENSYGTVIKTIQTNLVAVISCIQKAFKSMAARDVDGYIINICSVAGHIVGADVPGIERYPMSAYTVSKHAIKTLNQMIGQELVHFQKPKIRISNISPGLVVGTNIMQSNPQFNSIVQNTPCKLFVKDISSAAMYILATPTNVQIREIVIDAAGMSTY